ncbi:MAG: hypothetical protein ACE5GI_00365, partial [Candidatus Aminicenantales bacterium]
VTRPWAGPEFWANRLQDWRVANGRLEYTQSSPEKPVRTVHILTRSLNESRDIRFCLAYDLTLSRGRTRSFTFHGTVRKDPVDKLKFVLAALYDRAPGYGIIRFSIPERTITVECWPRWEDPGATGAHPYPGWPITIREEENDRRKAHAFLPLLKVKGLREPVVQVIEEASGEILYTLRISGDSFRPKVFRDEKAPPPPVKTRNPS